MNVVKSQVNNTQRGKQNLPKERIRWWVFPLAALLIPINSVWIARSEGLDTSGFPTCISLFYNVVFTLVVLMLINNLIRRIAPAVAFCRREMIIVYAMVATGSSLVGLDYMHTLVGLMAYPATFLDKTDKWTAMFFPHLPRWLVFTEPVEAVRKYQFGFSSLTWEYFKVWLPPILAWSVFLVSIAISGLCVNIILKKRWVEQEKLAYPIVQIPMMITENGGSNELFRNRLFWTGFSIAAAIDLINGFHQFFPNLPIIHVKMTDVTPYVASQFPWSMMGGTYIAFNPFAIGLSFFMPTNVAFSTWFFFLVRKLELVAAAAMGYQGGTPPVPYVNEQAYGAWIAIFIATLWFSKGYLKDVWNEIITGGNGGDEGGISYRMAFAGLVASLAVSAGFIILAGMTPGIAVLYVLLYLALCVAITRVRAELGPPTHELANIGTINMMSVGFGTSILGAKNLTIFTLLFFQNVLYRSLLMPQQAESIKAAHESGIKTRTMVFALVAAAVIGVFAAFWAHLYVAYGRHYTAGWNPAAPGSAWSRIAFGQLTSWLQNPTHTNWDALAGVGVGALIALILARLSVAIYGFPFHPAGFAVGMVYGVDYIWLPIVISWLAKVIILRYSGLRGYRKATPFFVGLVLGEFVIGGMWAFARGVLGIQTYSFY